MNRRQFLKFLAQSSASVGATVFVERVWGFPTVAALSSNKHKLFFWGAGNLNLTTTSSPPVNALTPAKILRRHNFSSIKVWGHYAASAVAIGTTQKGDILTWGSNLQTVPLVGNVDSPLLFGNTTTWSHVATSNSHGVAIKTGGTLWTWGTNNNGQLGDGTSTTKTSPVQIGALSTWTYVVPSNTVTYALRAPGTLWSWGLKTYLGFLVPPAFSVSSPIQIGSFSNWAKISASPTHVLGTRTNGELWAWGQSYSGQLGNGSAPGVSAIVSSPIQIGADLNWSQVYAIPDASYGIKTDGTLWAWGSNLNGELGIPTFGFVSTPTQVGSASNWASLSPSFFHAIGLKTDSTVWGWGVNDKGQLGTGSTTPMVSTPIQIGTSNTWLSVAAVGETSFGIRK